MTPLDGVTPAVRTAVTVVAGLGLPAVGPAPEDPLPDGEWRALVRTLQTERMLGLLDQAVAAGALPATPEQAALAEEVAAQPLRAVLHVERRLLSVAPRLTDAGVPFLVLKGPAIAHLDEDDPSRRAYADLDLLVRSADIDAAVAALAGLGYARDLPPRRAAFDRRFGKEVSLADAARSEIDVHRTLVLGPFGLRLDLPALWASTDSFPLGGTELSALDAEGRFAHACLNAVLGDARPRLVAVRDVALIACRHDLRADRLARLLPPGRGTAVVAAALAMCRRVLGVEVGGAPAAVATHPTTLWEKAALRAYRSQGGSNTLELLAGALGLQGADRLRYLSALVMPGAAYRSARKQAGRPAELTTGVREVLRWRRRPPLPTAPAGRNAIWQPKAGVADAEVDGERVLWDPETGQVVRLDRIGSLLWGHLDGATSAEELSADAAAAFETPLEVVRADLDDLLERLRQAGLVVETTVGRRSLASPTIRTRTMAHGNDTELLVEGSALPRPSGGVQTLDIDGEVVLLDTSTDGIHRLDRLGSIIWSVLDGEATVDELASDLADAFDAADDVVRKDLDDLLAGLRRIGVLEGFDLPEPGHAHDRDHDHGSESAPADDGLWKPVYLVNPPAP